MANFVQGLILLALAGIASAAGFSHAQHLKLDVTCLNCHGSAVASSKVADNNLPRLGTCTGCHGASFAFAFKQPREFFLAKFPHRLHVKSVESCASCHANMAQSAVSSRANFPVMADCIVCHNKIVMTDSCETCHTPGSKLRPATHTQTFIDSHNRATTVREGCAVCHGKNFTCAGCHQGQ